MSADSPAYGATDDAPEAIPIHGSTAGQETGATSDPYMVQPPTYSFADISSGGSGNNAGNDATSMSDTCCMCLDTQDGEGDSAMMRWPHCSHPAHLRCAFHFLRAQRRPANGEQWPDLQRLRRVQCPARGEVNTDVNALEACTQRWGGDEAAADSYEDMVRRFVPAAEDLA